MAEKGFSEYFVDDGSDFSVEHGAILIVDMLNDFCKDGGKMPLKEGMETVEPLKALIAKGREKGLPIIGRTSTIRSSRSVRRTVSKEPGAPQSSMNWRPDLKIIRFRNAGSVAFIRLIWIWFCGSWGLKL